MKILFMLFILEAHAAVKYEAVAPKYQDFPFKEVCEKLGAKNLELIEAKSLTEIDCMGKVFSAIDFCQMKTPDDRSLTRALVDEKTKTVKCEHSSNVTLSVSCDKENAKYCIEPKKGCFSLKKSYAVNLHIVHSSVVENNLNCYYSK